MKTRPTPSWRIAALASCLSLSLSQAALVGYTADSSTLHLYHFNEAAGGSSAANAGTIGGNALSPVIGFPGDFGTVLHSRCRPIRV